MIDLITLHAHNKRCNSCGRFDNYIIVKKKEWNDTNLKQMGICKKDMRCKTNE